MRKIASWQLGGLAVTLILFALGISGFFQTANAEVPPAGRPLVPALEPQPAAVAQQNPTPIPLIQQPEPTQAGQVDVQGTLNAQATQILDQVTQQAALDQTATATALGTFIPGQVQPTAAPGQVTFGTAVPQGTPGAAGSGAGGGFNTSSCVYTVTAGDRLFRIALRFGLSTDAVAGANGIVNPALIVPDQQIRIPSPACILPTPIPPTPAPPTATIPGQPSPVPGVATLTPTPVPSGRSYVVQEGDTLFGISTRFGSKVTAIAQANNITNVNLIYVGQNLIIP